MQFENFDGLGLHETLRRAVQTQGYDRPTKIQIQAIPHVLEGRDLLGCAQTGTGKTAAFALPTLQRLAAHLSNAALGGAPSGGVSGGEAVAAVRPRSVTPAGSVFKEVSVEEALANASAFGGGMSVEQLDRQAGDRDSRHARGGERPRAADHAAQGRRGDRPGAGAKGGRRRHTRGLILAPTRELAGQIGESFAQYGKFTGLKHTVIFGGVGYGHQMRALEQGVDIVVATPGRLMDLMNSRHADISRVEILVLDEADQMLDLGFFPAIRRIVGHLPSERQTLMFSATMPTEIRKLADQLLKNPVSVQVAPAATPAERVAQSLIQCEPREKPLVLSEFLKQTPSSRTLVFTRTKHGADKLVKHLSRDGIRAIAIHGNKSHNARQRALSEFKSNSPPVLIATDIAARGLDIDDVSHVINFDVPNVPETYVHRIGRTGRAGAEGIAVTLCGRDERQWVRDIERLTRKQIRVVAGPEISPEARAALNQPRPTQGPSRPGSANGPRYQGGGNGGGGGGNGNEFESRQARGSFAGPPKSRFQGGRSRFGGSRGGKPSFRSSSNRNPR